MQSRLSRVVVIGLLITSLAQAALGSADAIGTSATVHNGTPAFASIEILFDARMGAFRYDVRATDPNGVPDLDRLIFHFEDDAGRLWTHTDRDWTRVGHEAQWHGVAHVGLDVWQGPFQVHLHVYDRFDAEADADAPPTILSPVLDTVQEVDAHDAPFGRSDATDFLPLMRSATVAAAPQLGLLLFVAVALAAVIGFAYRHTDPVHRRGGRPPGRS